MMTEALTAKCKVEIMGMIVVDFEALATVVDVAATVEATTDKPPRRRRLRLLPPRLPLRRVSRSLPWEIELGGLCS